MSDPQHDPDAFAREVVQRVPGYRRFLAAQGADANAAFTDLPLTTKQNYLLQYPIEEVCWDASLGHCHIIGSSSGFSKSGSVFWPKRPQDEGGYLKAIETMLADHYGMDRKRTLILCCMALGTWFGGMAITSALRVLATEGRLPITVATPGLNLAEAAEIYARFHAQFEQSLWITNPSNIGLITSLLGQRGVTPPAGSCSFPVVGEYFSEATREAVARRYGHPEDAPFVVWTGYGSADTGDIAAETAASIALRKFFHHHPALAQQHFGTNEVPMLLAPSPSALVEIVDGLIVVTKDQLVPLLRYNTRDRGGMLSRDALASLPGLPADTLAALPEHILYVHGRASNAVVFYGTNLDIREIDRFLLELPQDMAYAGLFTIRCETQDDITHLDLNIMVERDDDPTLAARYHGALRSFLTGKSLEFETKYTRLSQAAGEELIRVSVQRADARTGAIKHRHIIEP